MLGSPSLRAHAQYSAVRHTEVYIKYDCCEHVFEVTKIEYIWNEWTTQI